MDSKDITAKLVLRASKPYMAEPWTPAVYMLLRESEIVYVGETTDLHRRLREHSKLKQFDRYFYLRVKEYENRKFLERWFIAKFKPPLNKENKLKSGEVSLSCLSRLTRIKVSELRAAAMDYGIKMRGSGPDASAGIEELVDALNRRYS